MKNKDLKMQGLLLLHIEAASAKHPNEMKFSGVLVRVDEASTKAPHGSDGHKILIPSSLAASKLKTLINMPVNYHDKLDQHHPGRPVGVIKAAKIVGKDLIISGVIWKKNFPNAPKDLSSSKLGMSFEAADISVADKDADVWVLSGMCFTGATILYKESAAYFNTSAKALAAAASGQQRSLLTFVANSKRKGAVMATKAEKEDAKKLKAKKMKAAKLKAAAEEKRIADVVAAAMAPVLKSLKRTHKTVEALAASVAAQEDEEEDDEVEASEDEEEDDDVEASEEDDDEEEVAAAKKTTKKTSKKDDDEEDDDEMESDADDADDLEDMGDDDDDEETGSINKKVVNKGRNVATKPAGKNKKGAPNVAASAQIDRLNRTIKSLRKLTSTQAQAIEAAAERTDRRTISASAVLASTLAKGNLNPTEMMAAGEKVSVDIMDTMCAAAGITGVQSMALKNEATRMGLMD